MTEYSIVVLEDNLILRYLLKQLAPAQLQDVHFHMYSSDNGIEGLGLIFVLKPAFIIIDSTLPKYSGKELMFFLQENSQVKELAKKIIIMGYREELEYPDNKFTFLKKDKYLFSKLQQVIADTLHKDHPIVSQTVQKQRYATNLLRLSEAYEYGIIELHSNSIFQRILFLIPSLLLQILLGISFTLYVMIHGVPKEADVAQKNKDLAKYRQIVYFTIISFTASTFFICAYIILFILSTTGIVLINQAINSL